MHRWRIAYWPAGTWRRPNALVIMPDALAMTHYRKPCRFSPAAIIILH